MPDFVWGIIAALFTGGVAWGANEIRVRRVIKDAEDEERDRKALEVRVGALENEMARQRERAHTLINDVQKIEGRHILMADELRDAQKELRADILAALAELRADFRALLGKPG